MIFISKGLIHPLPLGPAPPGAPLGEGGQGYPKVKMKIIFGFPTIENPRIDITHDIW